MTIPIIIKLLASLAVIILLNRLLHKLWVALIGGALTFSVWVGLAPGQILSIASRKVFSLELAGLLSLVSLVIILSLQMERTKMVHELVHAIRSRFSSRTSLAMIPAVIGLLPMPGGALFSAPLLDNFDDLEGITPDSKTNINYWFRHVWEVTWPLYPGVIVACAVSGLQLWHFFIFGLPMSLFSIITGRLFYLRKVSEPEAPVSAPKKGSLLPFLPVITVIALYVLIQFALPAVAEANRYLPMVIGLLGSVTILHIIRPLKWSDWKHILRSPQIGKMLLIILMVNVYGSYIEADIGGTTVVQRMAVEMQQLGIPSLPLIMVLPFLTGMTMGVSLGFAGTAMPVVVALLGPDPSFLILIGTVIFAYVSGFMGTMLSPLHVCMIVTSEYYKTDLVKSYQPVFVPALLQIVVAFGYMMLLRLLL